MKDSELLTLMALIVSICASNVAAQTVILSEGFGGNFPQDNNWSVGDDNPSGTTAYWDDVPAGFGSAGVHSGLWKGYCAGVSYGGTSQHLYKANWHSSGNWQFKQSVAMASPSVPLKCGPLQT